VGCGGGPGDLRPRTRTRVDELLRLKLREGVLVKRQSLSLEIRPGGTFAIGTFVPVEAKPAQVVDGSLDGLGTNSGRVQVFDPKHDSSASGTRREPGGKERASVAEV